MQRIAMRDEQLDGLLASEARRSVAVPPALFARVLADAEAEQAVPGEPVTRRAGPWRAIVGFFAQTGGGFAVGGAVASAVLGLWLGLAPPAALAEVTDAIWQPGADDVDLVELIPAYDALDEAGL